MDVALALAERGRYTVAPNPMVGAVVVRNGGPVGEGFHRRAGGPHAEVVALAAAGDSARGADLYVTLEPCAHRGRTPPCVDAILRAGIRRVVVAGRDPNPIVRGRGIAALSRGNVAVAMAAEDRARAARRQNEKFRHWITRGTPFVLAKWAATLDGKIATEEGSSRWITGPRARRRALLLREEYDAVLVGARTVLIDDPLLTRRLGKSPRPHRRIVLDGRLRVRAGARVFSDPVGALLVTAQPAEHPEARRLAARGVEVWSLPDPSRRTVSIRRLLERLGARQVTSLLVEGGSETLWLFFRGGWVDRIAAFVAPRLLGGRGAPGALGGTGYGLARTPRVRAIEIERLGEDLLITGAVQKTPATRR